MKRTGRMLVSRCAPRTKVVRRLLVESLEPRLNMALDVPAFSSLPGANHTIYLDFDGHSTTGTSWNSSYNVTTINSPAYSTDADTANFSAAELTNIERTFKRVSEDFAPFNVNVTTVEPPVDDLIKSGTGDTRWGVRVVVTKDVAFNCGCGGIAYINSFNWNSDTPVFVFNTSEIGVAEAVSHEVGHALGLAHDGTASVSYYQGHGSGATSWAPIMGVGYYVNVSQWDTGEYYGSNNAGSSANYNKGPDDLAVITNYNGFGYKTDDHGNTNAAASSLNVAGTSVSASGLIETRGDVDVFQFVTGAGAVTLNVNPAALGANLDIQANLYDSTGALVTSVNPSTALNASISANLAAGQYFLRVDGVGVGDPTVSPPTGYTDYGSIGQYTISGTIVAASGDQLSIAAADASKAEGNSGSTAFTFTVNRSGDTSGTTTVDYAVTGSGSAPANATDFVGGALPTGSLTFGPGVTSQTVTIEVQGDTTVESTEAFTVTLANASAGTTLTTATAGGAITNDDSPPAAPTLSIVATDAAKNEGTGAATTPFLFTIYRAGDTSGASSVNYTVAGTTSKKASASDFSGGLAKNVVVNFAAGVSSVDITLNVIADSTRESNEAFKVTLSGAVGATISISSANGTIINDDGVGAAGIAGRSAGNVVGEDDEEIIAVADPLWMFLPPEMLTPEQLAVPVITWINGVSYVGDLAHDHEGDDHDHDQDHGAFDDDHELFAFDTTGLSRSVALTDAADLATWGVVAGEIVLPGQSVLSSALGLSNGLNLRTSNSARGLASLSSLTTLTDATLTSDQTTDLGDLIGLDDDDAAGVDQLDDVSHASCVDSVLSNWDA